MKFHAGCEWLCTFWAPFQLLIYLHPVCECLHLLCSISIADMPPWNYHLGCEWLCTSESWAPFQLLTCLHRFHPGSECLHLLGPISIADMPSIQWMSTSWALFQLLICPYKIPSSKWVAVHLLVSISIANICTMKSHSASEWLCTFWIPFQLLIFLHKIPFSLWVVVHLLSSIANISLWNFIQQVSGCAPPGLHFNCWHVFMKSYSIPSREWVAVHLLGSIWITDISPLYFV